MRIVGVNQKTGDIFIQRGVKTEHHIKNITASSAKRLHYVLDRYGEQSAVYLGGYIRTYYFQDFYPQPAENHSVKVLKEIENVLLEARRSAFSKNDPYREAVVLHNAIEQILNMIEKEPDR